VVAARDLEICTAASVQAAGLASVVGRHSSNANLGAANTLNYAVNCGINGNQTAADATAANWATQLIASRTASNVLKFYRGATLYHTGSTASTTPITAVNCRVLYGDGSVQFVAPVSGIIMRGMASGAGWTQADVTAFKALIDIFIARSSPTPTPSSTVRSGGMGLGLRGLSLSGGYSGGVTASSTADYTVSNATELATTLSTIISLGSGSAKTVDCLAGEYGPLNISSKTFAAEVILRRKPGASRPYATQTDITSPAPALEINTCTNLTFDGWEIYHSDEASLNGDAYWLTYIHDSTNFKIKNSIIRGSDALDTHKLDGLKVLNCTNFTYTLNECRRVSNGAKLDGCTGLTISYNKFLYMQSDGLNPSTSSNVTITYNLFDQFTPYHNPLDNNDPLNDHPDPIQFLGRHANESANNVLIAYNMVRGSDDHVRPQGIFPDNDTSDLVYTRFSNFTIRGNVTMCTQVSAIFLNGIGGGTNLVELNEVYDISDATDGAGSAQIRFYGTTATYQNNIANINNQAANTLTNGGGNTATASITKAQAQAKVDAFTAAYLW
jgi:hypothetical protein